MPNRGRPRPLLLLVSSAWLAAGCQTAGSVTDGAVGTTGSATATSAAAIEVGSDVVVARGELSFVQGTVTAIVGEQVAVRASAAPSASDDGGAPASLSVSRDRVWPLAGLAPARAGGVAICRLDHHPGSAPSWQPCRVQTIARAVRVRDARATEHTLASSRVLVPDERTVAALTGYLDREARHHAFDEAFAAAGAPRPPAGWVAAAGDEVVARFVDSSWYGAEVLEVATDKGKVRVRWDGGTWDDQDVPLADLVPRPPARGSAPASQLRPGQFAIAPPQQVSGRWEPLRVVAVRGDSVTVESRDGAEVDRKPTDLLPVAP